MPSERDDERPEKTGAGDAEATLSASGLRMAAALAGRPMPESIGGYRILSLLGEGGMGVVWEAEQQHPRRRVALKVLREGHLGDELHARLFHREAETLGRLKHPNIAAIYESGRTEDGRDFFAMELVAGVTLGTWLGRRPKALTPQEVELRLRLFRTLCDAVHSAHQRGVIHRDLKPANIIVNEEAASGAGTGGMAVPVAKILDFGLARITSADMATASLLTEVGIIKGTLAYMAPEQARGDGAAIDVRTDIYALGVILYELLAGRRPYDVVGIALAEAVRMICETPPRPLTEEWSGTGRLDRDLATIAGKALEKEPERRYESAAALGDDVERYLTSQPIAARPPSVLYQLRKLAVRNKIMVAGVAATIAALVAGLAVSSALYLRAEKARQEAAQRTKELEQVTDFQSTMLAEIDITAAGKALLKDLRDRQALALDQTNLPAAERAARVAAFAAALAEVNGADASAAMIDRTILTPAVAAIEVQFRDQPLVDAILRMGVANTYVRLGRHEKALALQQQALAIRKRLLGDDHPETLRAQGIIADRHSSMGRFAEAEPLYREVLTRRRRVLGEDHPETIISLTSLGNALTGTGRLAEAEPLLREALAKRRRILGEEHEETLVSINSLGFLLQEQGKLAEAEPLRREALAKARKVRGEEHVDTLIYMVNMASLLEDLGRHGEAEPLLRDAVEKRRRLLGEEHPRTLGARFLLGALLRKEGKLDEAEPLLRDVLEKRRKVLGEEHRSTLLVKTAMAAVLLDRGRQDESIALLAPAEAAARKAFASDPYELGSFLEILGRARAALAQYAAAEPLLVESNALFGKSPRASPEKRRAGAQALVTFYTAWHAAEPGKSHDTQAVEWERRLRDISVHAVAASAG